MEQIETLFDLFRWIAEVVSSNPIFIPLVFSVVAFVIGIVISQRADSSIRIAVGATIAVIMWLIAPYASEATGTRNPLVFNTFLAIGAEIFGGICVVLVGYEGFNWNSKAVSSNVSRLLVSLVSILALLVLGWLFIEGATPALFKQVHSDFPLIAYGDLISGALSVEVLASGLVNAPLFLMIYLFFSVVMLMRKPLIGGLLLIALLLFVAISIGLIRLLPPQIFTNAFPRSLELSCAGALFSIVVAHLWRMIKAHENVFTFAVVSIAMLIIAGGLLVVGTADESFEISAATEIFGIVVTVALLEEHPFAKRKFQRKSRAKVAPKIRQKRTLVRWDGSLD